jgi:hypothetical protein
MSQSRRVGTLVPRRGQTRAVYAARVPLTCRRCGGAIQPGEGFVYARPSPELRPMPACSRCIPLERLRVWADVAVPPNVRSTLDKLISI